VLFLFLAVFFVGIAFMAIRAGGGVVVIGVAALVLALWIGTLGLRVLLASRPR
jgi:hypothetical protein